MSRNGRSAPSGDSRLNEPQIRKNPAIPLGYRGRGERIPDLFSTASEKAQKIAVFTLPDEACGTICGTICGTARYVICAVIWLDRHDRIPSFRCQICAPDFGRSAAGLLISKADVCPAHALDRHAPFLDNQA